MSDKKEPISYNDKGLTWTTFPELCKSCGLCVEKCPVKCLSFNEEDVEFLGLPTVKCAIEKCINCKTCVTACPDCAIKIEGKR